MILLLIVVYTVLTIGIYGLATGLIEEQISSINSGFAAQIQSRLDTHLAETRAIGIEVANASYAIALAVPPGNHTAEYSWAYRDMVDYLRVTAATHTFIESILVYYRQSGIIVNNDGLSDGSSESIDETILTLIDRFSAQSSTVPAWNNFTWMRSESGRFFYVQSLGGVGDKPILLIILDNDYMATSLREIPKRYGGTQCILDRTGFAVFSSGGTGVPVLPPFEASDRAIVPQSEIQPDLGAIATIPSEVAQLVCCSFIPERLYLSDLKRLRRLFLSVAVAATSILLFLTIYFVRVHYRPVRRIIESFDPDLVVESQRKNEYQRILEYSAGLLSANTINQEQLRRVQADMDQQLLERLVQGTLSFENLPEHLRLPRPNDGNTVFRLVLLSVPGSGFPQELVALYASEILESLPSPWNSRMAVYTGNALAIVLTEQACTQSDEELLLQHFDACAASITRRTSLTPFTILGNPFKSLAEIHTHYIVCRHRMEEALFFMQQTTLRADTMEPEDFLYLEQFEQDHLVNAVKEGSFERATDVIERITKRIDGSDGASIDNVRSIFFATLTTVIQTVANSPVEMDEYMLVCSPKISRFFQAEDIRSMTASLLEIINVSCNKTSRRRSDYTQRLIEQIRDYVDQHIDDCGLYLPAIATSFGMNPKYLSVFYKEHDGTSLAEYIRRRRVTIACQLLLSGKPVGQTATETGFANTVSFNRTFKRITGVTPTEYRRMKHQTTAADS